MERPSHKTLCVDYLEGQRPRLTHFSTTGSAEIAFRHNSRGIDHRGHREHRG
jgi:hypothetical protein